jgi:PTH1 family peptidyl-tRNA hydrolase
VKLIVGLGNPGQKYDGTRHNVGFMLVDVLIDRHGGRWEGTAFQAEVAKLEIFGEKSLLIKPQTYMNLSGRSVRDAAKFYKIEPQDIVVIQDDLDMPSLKVKLRTGGGHGGNNGIRSILEEMASDGFHRIKVGIGRPAERGDESSWVLSKFSTSEVEIIRSEVYDSVALRLKEIFSRN